MTTATGRGGPALGRRRFLRTLATGLALAPVRPVRASDGGWQAAAASIDITPTTSVWMAGFARRAQASEGTERPLHAKALALRAGDGRVAVLVTADLLGLTARITSRVSAAVARRHGLRRRDLLFNASHTHCGPVVDDQLAVAYDLTEQQWSAIRDYSGRLEGHLAAVIEMAVNGLTPARLSYGVGRATFAANRRVRFSPDGPVDHGVPVLRVARADGTPLALVFGYACHNTTLQHEMVRFHGDYAGVAQEVLEERHRGATALFVAGCGADANPNPRGTLALAEAHGTALAEAVTATLPALALVRPSLRTAYETVDLPFASHRERERWLRQLDVEPKYLDRYTAVMRGIRERTGGLPRSHPEPIQVWRLGGDLVLVALGGEVVVDYARRVAADYPDLRTWAAGYSNDVFGYVPSARVLAEGGYEGGDAMVYYGRPGPFDRSVEERIHAAVRRLVTS